MSQVWREIKIKSFALLVCALSLSVCWIMYGIEYFKDTLQVNHIWELQD